MAETKNIEVGGRLHSIATGNVLAGANEIIDDDKGKKQSVINAETDVALNNRYTKAETYNKTELNNMITTPNQQYVTVTATDQTTAATDVLPATGEADTVYRVGNWDGSQFDASVYSEYAWNGSQYVHLSTKTQIGEVFDISAYHATGGTLATYADLSAALDSNNGGGVPQLLQKGGMSVKYVQSSDNKYVQFRLMPSTFTAAQFANPANWQGVDEEPTAGSDNLVKSGGAFAKVIKLTGMSSAVGEFHITKVGDCCYRTTDKKIYRCTRYPISTFANSFAEVSFVDGAVYIYNNRLYVWNGSDLVPTEDEKAFNGIVTTQDLDTLFDSGTYKYTIGTIVIVTKYSNTDIRQISIGALSTETMRISYRKYNGTSWSDWEVYLDRQTNTKAIEAYYKTIELKCFASSLSDATRKGATVGDYFFNTTANKIDLIKSGGTLEVIPFIKGAVYAYNTVLYKWDFDSENLVLLEKRTPLYYVDVPLTQCNVLSKAVDAYNQWAGGKLYIISVKSAAKIKVKPKEGLTNALLFLKYIPDVNVAFDANSFAEGYNARVNVSTETEYDIPTDCNYICTNKESSNGTDITPDIVSVDVDAIQNHLAIEKMGGQTTNGGVLTLSNMPNLVPISDPLKALASGECNFYHEVATGLIYMVCIEGFDHPYEAFDCCSLYVFSLTNPNNVKRYQFAQKISDSKKCYTPNIVPIGTKQVRVFYSIQNEDSGYCYYRDFDFNMETFTEPQKATLSISGDLTNIVIDSSFHNGDILTGNMIRNFTVDNGGTTVSNGQFVYIEKISDVMSDGYRYATLCCGESTSYNLVLARSNDNFASIEFVAITPYLTRFDCAVAGLGSKLYFVHRVAGDEYAVTSGSALFTADITDLNDIVWSEDIKFAEGDSRTDCYQYKNKIYLMAGNYHSVSGKPMRISSSVWEGTSDNPSDYKKVLVVNDSRGVQNPRVFRYGAGDYGVLMQNSPARVDYANGWTRQYQFKTAVCFVHTRIN